MRGLSKKTIALLNFAYQLLEAFHPMNLRQLHYAIFSAAKTVKIDYGNENRYYRQLSRATSLSRRRYRKAELKGKVAACYEIPPACMVDELRMGEQVNVWDNAAEYADAVRDSYRRDLWQDQPVHCEVWGEKAATLSSLRPVTRALGVTLRVCRGFGSTGMEQQIGKLFEGVEKPIQIFYLGDHDASGDVIPRDIQERVQIASGKNFTMTRLAIFKEDIKRFRLPPQKIKEDDPRAPSFKQKYGKNAATVELDALPVEELRRRVREAIEDLIDFDRWNRQLAIQEAELKCIADFAERMKTLPPSQQIGL